MARSGPDDTQLVHATDDVTAQLDGLQLPLQVGTTTFGTVELYRGETAELSERDTAIAFLVVDELVGVASDDLTGPHRPILDIAQDFIARRLMFSDDRRRLAGDDRFVPRRQTAGR